MVKAELDFYDLFNALADEEKYKVKCRREFRAGSRIKNTVCHPQYVLNRMASETQDALNSGGPLPDFKDIEFLVQDEKEESLKYAAKVISKHPELLKKLNVMHQKQEEFKAMKDAS